MLSESTDITSHEAANISSTDEGMISNEMGGMYADDEVWVLGLGGQVFEIGDDQSREVTIDGAGGSREG